MLLQAATKKQKYEKISEKKMSTPVELLCKVRLLMQTQLHNILVGNTPVRNTPVRNTLVLRI